jgi:protease-4
MKRKTWYWIIGLSLLGLAICGGFIGLGVWAANQFDTGRKLNLGFGEGIAIIRVEGVIVPGEAPPPNPFGISSSGVAYSQTIIDHMDSANEDEDVKAIILAVDSPGGSVFASDEIHLKIKEIDKPIIASMGSLAASGGYFVSAPADEIWASPHTLTCSVGVIMQFLNLDGFSDEYGITAVTITSGKFKDTGNPFREFTEAERALLQTMVDEAYDAFVEVVAEGRDMSEEDVRAIADGRICTGKQAQAMGLVDNLGYLPDVIDRAAELGEIELEEDEEPRIIEYTQTSSFTDLLAAALYRPSPVEELKQILHFNAGSPLMYLYVGP